MLNTLHKATASSSFFIGRCSSRKVIRFRRQWHDGWARAKKRISNIRLVARGGGVRFMACILMDHQMFKMFYDIRAPDELVLCHVHHSISLAKGVNTTSSVSINKATETGFDNQTNDYLSTHSLRHHIQNPSSLTHIFEMNFPENHLPQPPLLTLSFPQI